MTTPETSSLPPLLVVDDDPAILRQMAWLFKPDYPVLTAGSAGDAIDLFLRERPAVAVLDLGLDREAGKDGGWWPPAGRPAPWPRRCGA